METYKLDRSAFSVTEILDALEKGKHPLCPVCDSLILIARTPNEAKELGIPPGMQCSKVATHFQVVFNLQRK